MQPKITYTNSAIVINDYEFGSCPSLEYNFKTYDPITHSYKLFGMYYDVDNKKLYLPRGIDRSFVESRISSTLQFGETPTSVIKKNHAYDRVRITMKLLPKDDRQKEALRFMCCKDKYDYNKFKSQFSVNLPTGAGKTYCSIATIALEGVRSIIISYQSSLLDQWIKCIYQYTDCKPNDICKITGSYTLLRVLNGSSSIMDKKIYLITHSTLQSFGDTYGWNKINDVFTKLKIGMKFFDEAHQNFVNMTMVDFYSNVYRTYYVTATPTRSAQDEQKVFYLYLKNIPMIDLFDEEEDPHTKYIAIKYNSMPRPNDIMECKNAYGLDRNKYVSYLMNNNRFWMMFDYIFNLIERGGGKALFFIQTNYAISIIKEYIISKYPEYRNDIGIYTTLSADKKIEREKRFILSTTKSAGAGEDIKGLKYTIVLAEPFKSSLLAQQTLGRTRDKDTFYIELIDVGFRQLENYYRSKLPTFKKYALSTKMIPMNATQVQSSAEEANVDRLRRFNRVIMNNVNNRQAISSYYEPTRPSIILLE